MRAKKSKGEIMAGLREGRFYASTGPVLDVTLVGGDLAVRCTEDSQIEFLADGEVVKSFEAREAAHSVTGHTYLRARVQSDGGTAWTQPVWMQER